MVIEDDRALNGGIVFALEKEGYHVHSAYTLQEAEKSLKQRMNLILLDINLPDGDGRAFLQSVLAGQPVPVLLLTARDSEEDMVRGFQAGCDDYITKPYQPPLLLARIAAVLKRTKGASLKEPLLFTHKGVALDLSRCRLQAKGESSELTKNEMKILHRLFLQPGQYVSRMDLIEYLWENQIFIDDNTLSVHMTRIREKLRIMGVTDFIGTKRGVGYRI